MNVFIKFFICKLLRIIPDHILNYAVFIFKHGYFPKISQPRSFSEKIVHLKLYDKNPLRALVVDRLKVRNYVKKKTDKAKFSKILWYGTKLTLKIWDSLPKKFVLKGNHGSGMILFVDKKKDSIKKIQKVTEEWMNRDYASVSREWFYGRVKRYIIAEELLNFNNEIPPDYKFFCFNGKVGLIQVDLNRFSKHRRNVYNRKFNQLDVQFIYPKGQKIKKPENFDLALKIAEQVSEDFDFIRVDLFLLKQGVYFGEMTNTPEGGFGKITPRRLDFKFGEKLFSNLTMLHNEN